MIALKTIALEGVAYLSGEPEDLLIERDDGAPFSVEAELAKLEGRQVRLALTHVPPNGPHPLAWGGGSCYWGPHGTCPAGHHLRPDLILVFVGEGTLTRSSGVDRWVLSRFDGSNLPVPLSMLPGHYCRLVGATTDAVERMRDILHKMDPDQQVEALTGQANDLRATLDRLRQMTGK